MVAQYSRELVQHGVNKTTILNRQKAYAILLLTFDFRLAVLVKITSINGGKLNARPKN